MNLLLDYPLIGTPTKEPSVRRLTTTPYPYLIFGMHTVDYTTSSADETEAGHAKAFGKVGLKEPRKAKRASW